MISFSVWVAFIFLCIFAIPFAAVMDKRKLRAELADAERNAMGEAGEPEAALFEEQATLEDPGTASVFEIEPDGVETRQADLLQGLAGEEMVAQFPDFDLAYLEAACPGGASEAGTANLTLLKSGLGGSIRKSWLLGRISCYWMMKGDAEKAFQYGVQSLLATSDVQAGDVAATITFLQPVFAAAKKKDLAAKLETLLPAGEAPVDTKQIKKLVKKMGGRKAKASVSEAAALLFAKGI